jgi:two-component system, OmpR family, copper resistance phosphate regulon response regulator CusR
MSKKILIVDDDSSILESLSKLLGAEGYEIELAEDGQQAIEKLVQNHVDLLLLDLGMPVKDGWSTMRWLAEVNPLFPVILMTGQSNQRAPAARAGADVLMEKPLDVPRLLQIIHDLIDEPMECRLQRAIHRPVGFRYLTCDHEKFLELQNKRFTTPYPCPGLKNS